MNRQEKKAENDHFGLRILMQAAGVCGLTILGFILVLVIWFMIVLAPDNLSKKQIFSLVRENQAFLLECVAGNDLEQAKQIKGIKSTYRPRDQSYCEFSCGGSGLVTSSSYYGFYYSPDDSPLAVDVTSTENLVPVQDGFGWQEPKGDNRYYTERITENWYYYESHY